MRAELESISGKARVGAVAQKIRMVADIVVRRSIVAPSAVHTTMANLVAQALRIAQQRLGVSFDDDAQRRSSAARRVGCSAQLGALRCYTKVLAGPPLLYYINTTAARRAAINRRAT